MSVQAQSAAIPRDVHAGSPRRCAVGARDVELFAAKMNINLSHAEIARLLAHVSRGGGGDTGGGISRAEFTR